MYELLLQADKALADGQLDQAERTYWQLIELDPSNAIAVAGLARVSLERGDERLARRLADRAMLIDPESAAARRIVDSLDHKGGDQPEADLPDLPMMAAERLEALGRRRTGARREKPEDEDSPAEAAAGGPKAKSAMGSQAAATPPARHRHAIPAGMRRFGAAELRVPTQNAYAAAEAAAAAEAVDAMDVAEETPQAGPGPVSGAEEDVAEVHDQESEAHLETADDVGEGEDVGAAEDDHTVNEDPAVVDDHEAEDATPTIESVSRRIALVVNATELDAEELAAAETIEAGAVAADESVTPWLAPVPDEVEKQAAALRAAWVEAEQARWRLDVVQAHATEPKEVGVGTVVDTGRTPARGRPTATEPPATEPPVGDELEVAETEAARLAPKEMLEAPSPEQDVSVEREAPSPRTLAEGAEGPSERDAEIDALRDALAIVLGSESQADAAEPGSTAAAVPPNSTSAVRPRVPKVETESAEPPEATPESDTPPRRKKGLFRRFGSR